MVSKRRWLKIFAFVAVGCTILMICRFATAHVWNLLSPKRPCRWPPSSLDDIRVNGTYDITICAQMSNDGIPDNQPKRYLLSDLFNIPETNETVTFNSLSLLSREIWKKVRYPRIYDTYPQDVPIREIVDNIKAGKPVSHLPKYNFPITILERSKSVCAEGTKHDLVIVVKNGIYNSTVRREFREFMRNQSLLYPEIKVGYVFSVGVPRSQGGRQFYRDGQLVNLTGPAGDMLEYYNGRQKELMETIKSEIDAFDDILLADYEDTYFNLTWKTVTNLRWLSAFCNKNHSDFFMLIDDDHRMNLSVIQEFNKSTPTSDLRTFLHGKIAFYDRAWRIPTRKWYLSYNEVPWNAMSPYPRGMSQLIGADIVDDMAIASAYTRYNYVNEDVFLGLVARKLGITVKNVNNMYEHTDYLKHPKNSKPPMVALSAYFSQI